ncbi:formylglycine-generating enzyme family protein [Arthrobacter sp. 179]
MTAPDPKENPLSCCHGPARSEPAHTTEAAAAASAAPAAGPATKEHRLLDTVELTGGTFSMGDAFDEGYPHDGELPVHDVSLSPYSIDATTVTNTEFNRFVQATGFRTESEEYGYSAVFHLLVDADERDILGRSSDVPWWITVRGSDWAHPHGPRSSWRQEPHSPVVQVSWNDAVAYCRWAGRSLPTEAQWEHAARGGLESRRYAWGDELLAADGGHRCNIWQGRFPVQNTLEDGYLGPAPTGTFAPNGFGLYEMAGNVWEWCADWFDPGYYRNSPRQDPAGPPAGPGRVMRGGSFLCHDSYCNRYRVSARSANTPDSASSNLGFRTVADFSAPPR